MTAKFNVEEFLQSPSWEEIDKLKKNELLEIATYFKAGAMPSMRKQEIKNVVIQTLVDEEALEESALQHIVHADKSEAFKLKELELKYQLQEKLELEKMKIQYEETMKQEEFQMKKELEYAKLKFESEKFAQELELKKSGFKGNDSSSSSFDPTKYVKFVPQFKESEVDQFFLHFEKVATSLKWPKDSWALLLQSVLVGKAREAFSAMSVADSADYDLIKTNVLKAYELVPEAYRQKFRSTQKAQCTTHVEFVHEKEQLLNRWLTAKGVNGEYEKLRQLILIEEFKRQIHSDIKTHLDESKIETISQAATIADDYAIKHKLMGKSNFNQKANIGQSRPTHPKDTTGDKPKWEPQKSKANNESGTGASNKSLTCNYCRKRGHIVSEC
jgi:hypothetical protein